MVKRIKALVKLVCVLFILILHADATASAEEGNIMNGFWGVIDAGAGNLSQSLDGEN